MSNIHGFTQQDNVSRAADGTSVGIRATRDGAIIQTPWLQALCLEGRVFGAFGGAADLDATGPGTFGDGAVDNDEFDFHCIIPSTVAILPVFLAMPAVAIGTIDEVTFASAWGTDSVVGAGGISLTAYNVRPGSSNSSDCTVGALYNTGGTALAEEGFLVVNSSTALTGVAATPAQLVPAYSAATSAFVPVLEGARQWVGWNAGQATTGYILASWVELPIAAVR